MPNLIGLGGSGPECGKDTVADWLVENHGYYKTYMSKPLELALLKLDPYVRVSPSELVATGLNQDHSVLSSLFVPYKDVHQQIGYQRSKRVKDVRRLLKLLGTEVGRDMAGESVWIDLVAAEASVQMESGRSVVITGIRFQNELARVRELGGVTIYVDAVPRLPRPTDGHRSEAMAREDFDFGIDNKGSLEELYVWLRNGDW